MSIARKLWLGFGILILIFLAAGLIILLRERDMDRSLAQITRVDGPTNEVSLEMEINAVEISRSVLGYLLISA